MPIAEHMERMSTSALGWPLPILSFVMACVGSALALRCTVRAAGSTGTAKWSAPEVPRGLITLPR